MDTSGMLDYQAGMIILLWIPGQHERGRGNEKAYGCVRNRLVLRTTTTPWSPKSKWHDSGRRITEIVKFIRKITAFRTMLWNGVRVQAWRQPKKAPTSFLSLIQCANPLSTEGHATVPLPVKGGLQWEVLIVGLLLGHIHVPIRVLLARHQAGHTRSLPTRHHMPRLLREA